MSSRLTMILIGIVVLPLAITGWLVGRTVRNEQAIAEQRYRLLATLQLQAVNERLAETFARIGQEATAGLASLPAGIDDRRSWTDASLHADQLYVIDPQRRLIHPPIATPAGLARSERDALTRTGTIWDGGALASEIFDRSESSLTSARERGWFTWYWGDGLRWIAWYRTPSAIYAVELQRARVLSEIINALPDTKVGSPETLDGMIRLRDASDRVIYQWGPDVDAVNAIARIPAVEPLSAWSLEYHAASVAGAATLSRLGMLAGLIALAVAVSALALYLHREQTRRLREAGQRVSFVNQVSHELKTPLTNIRMYAELMAENDAEQGGANDRHLGVIVAESQRLSRLINNVLTFGGKQKGKIDLHRRPIVLDEVVRTVVDGFRPSLESKEIELELRLDARRPIAADPDRLEQIVGNLLNNVEKYAAAGRFLRVETRIVDGRAEMTVEDRGPGIAASDALQIFQPFYRASDSLTEGVSGAGLGLSIARDLARLHGGELVYEPVTPGSRFRLTLPVESERS